MAFFYGDTQFKAADADKRPEATVTLNSLNSLNDMHCTVRGQLTREHQAVSTWYSQHDL
jgi:hypothetical protein